MDLRVIPLTSISLEAFREHPKGFPRYADSSALSTTINRYLSIKGLLETPKHSLYGLRHSFEDSMLEAGIDERIRRDLLGHSLNRVRYGRAELKYIRSLLEPVAI